MITMPLVLSDNIDRKTQAAHYSSLIRHYFIYYFIFLDLFNRSVHHLWSIRSYHITKKSCRYKSDISIRQAPHTI